MSVWRYTAVEIEGPRRSGKRRGELAGESAAEVRASLRRVGLQVIDLHPVRAQLDASSTLLVDRTEARWTGLPWRTAWSSVVGFWRGYALGYVRGRRRHERAELYDSLATMLASGLPLLEAVDTVVGSTKGRRSSLRWMLVQVRQRLRSGSSLARAMTVHPSWFEASEVAMVGAGQHSGTLPEVLKALSERHERSGELSHRLTAALAYPSIVAMVGLGVVVFLSVKTLPDLAQVLAASGIETPALTEKVMAFGRYLAGSWLAIGLGLLALIFVAWTAAGLAGRWGFKPPSWLRRLYPKVLRRMAVARLSLHLAELLRTGVPVVEALRVLAPTTAGGGGALRRRLLAAADRVERGDELAAALDDEQWFDAEFRRLLTIGQASGELEVLLERIGNRYARQATRLIDRLTTLLEPCVILTLAVLVGIVVMAAVLPLLRLGEIL
ncbi:MAG: type II secretion system F family protein [Planctomycetota bacterium]|jgi:type II secretory pathway component PulF